MVWEECIPLRSNWWECSQVETKNISFILVSNNKCLLSCKPLPFVFDYLPSAYLIAHNCGTTWRFWFSDSVVPTFVRTVKHVYILIWNYIPPYKSNLHIHTTFTISITSRLSLQLVLFLPLLSPLHHPLSYSFISYLGCLPLQWSLLTPVLL